MTTGPIVLAGATGRLGGLIAARILERGAPVRALVRREGAAEAVRALREQGAEITEVDFEDRARLAAACAGGSCVVSALAGLRDVIVDRQSRLLQAAVAAGVPRFIPSDYCIDYTKLPPGSNRNLDLRREFHDRVEGAPVAATSILNGAFTDLLTGNAPIVLFGWKRVLYWGDADQRLDFTSIEDTAAVAAAVALDPSFPRYVRVAGDQVSARDLAAVMSELTGERFRLLRAGGLGRLRLVIRLARRIAPGGDELYPPWQGMQYLHDMFSGRGKLEPLDNDRFPGMHWTTARDVLAAHLAR